MKKTMLIFGAVLITATSLTSCTQGADTPKVKNYYGVESDSNGTYNAAYGAFLAGLLVLAIFAAWLWKKIRKS